MKQVTLENLRCLDAEDTFGDECRLEVFNDGELYFAYRNDLDDGGDWAVGASLLFASHCTIRLYDEDGDLPGDDDDLLGVVTIGGSPVTHGVAELSGDGARYELTYSVVDRPDLGAVDLATFALDQFAASTAPGVWPHIDKPTLIDQIRQRRWNPTVIDQVSSNFCGPTSISYELARTQPRRYVDLCRQLFETGGFWSRTRWVSASSRLRAGPVGQGMAAADWMLVATMRESENAIFGVSPTDDGPLSAIQGMTTPWEMQGWTSEILLKDHVINSTTILWGELDAIRYAEQVFAAGGHAFVMIHSDLMSAPDGTVPPWPDHWIVYQGGLEERDGRIRFNTYTWAAQHQVDQSPEHVEDCMFGVVTGF